MPNETDKDKDKTIVPIKTHQLRGGGRLKPHRTTCIKKSTDKGKTYKDEKTEMRHYHQQKKHSSSN